MKAESMSDNLAERRSLRRALLLDVTRDHSIADLLHACGREGIDAERTALLAADKTGRSRAHQIARLHVLIAWCEFQQSGGFKDWEAVRELFREASALWNRFRWDRLTLPAYTPNDLDFPFARADCMEAIRAWAEEKIDELEGCQKSQRDEPCATANDPQTTGDKRLSRPG